MTQRNLFITVAFLLLLGSLSVKADTARPPAAPVYLILDITVHDTDTYAQYREKVEPVIKNYGGRYVVRSGAKSFDNNPAFAVISPEGEWYPDRIIISAVRTTGFYVQDVRYAAGAGSAGAVISRLAALVPKPRVNLTRYHGVFAPHSLAVLPGSGTASFASSLEIRLK